jgi:tetratricopeptide (TPR) repeat protein
MRLTGDTSILAGAHLSLACGLASLLLLTFLAYRLLSPTVAIVATLFYTVLPFDLTIFRRTWQESFIVLLSLALIALAACIARAPAGRRMASQIAPALRNADSYLAEGLNYLHTGDYDQAIYAWQRVLSLDPANALAANNIGTAYMLKQQPSLAATWFQKAIALDPSQQIAKNNLAWARNELAKSSK